MHVHKRNRQHKKLDSSLSQINNQLCQAFPAATKKQKKSTRSFLNFHQAYVITREENQTEPRPPPPTHHPGKHSMQSLGSPGGHKEMSSILADQ
jgi:hypothetical protein